MDRNICLLLWNDRFYSHKTHKQFLYKYIIHNIVQNMCTYRHVHFCSVNYPFLIWKGKASVSIYLRRVSKQLKIPSLYYIIISINVLIYLDFSDNQRILLLHPNQNLEKNDNTLTKQCCQVCSLKSSLTCVQLQICYIIILMYIM